MPHLRLASLAAVAVVALAVSPANASPCGDAADLDATDFRGPLVQLTPQANAFSHASASFEMSQRRKGTRYTLRIRGVDRAAVGTTYGAHLHTGPCVAGDGAAAGPHYNASTATPPVVSSDTEVWLDFTVKRKGKAGSEARTSFTPTPGNRSVVIHAMPTAHDGTAGARLACLPVSW